MSAPATAEVLSVSPPAMSRRRARDLWRGVARVGESRPATVGVLIILFWLAVAAFAPLLAPYPPNASDLAALAHPTPSRAHWLGTDHLGRDLLSRLAWGARPVLVIAPLAVLGAPALGCLLGPAPRSRLGRHGQGHLRDDERVAAHGARPVRGDLVARHRLQPARRRAPGARTP